MVRLGHKYKSSILSRKVTFERLKLVKMYHSWDVKTLYDANWITNRSVTCWGLHHDALVASWCSRCITAFLNFLLDLIPIIDFSIFKRIFICIIENDVCTFLQQTCWEALRLQSSWRTWWGNAKGHLSYHPFMLSRLKIASIVEVWQGFNWVWIGHNWFTFHVAYSWLHT